MIIVAGRLQVRPEDRDGYLGLVAEVTAQARRAPGCLDFVQGPDPLEPSRIVIYERWESEEDLERFRTSGDPEVPEPELPDVLSAEVWKYRIASVEAP